jgi:hypothetical protein
MSRLVRGFLGALFVTSAASVPGAGPCRALEPDLGTESDGAVLARFLARPDESHTQLRGRRRMRADGLGKQAFMDVRVSLDPGIGFRYDVEAEGGSGLIRERAFRALLEKERDHHDARGLDRSSLTAENYRLTGDGREPDGLVRLRAVPRRREAALLDGRFLVNADTADLVRAEGRLARAPSFWISRVDVVRHYRRIQGHRVQAQLESVAHVRLLGDVHMVVDFDYEMVDGDELSRPD